MFQFACRKGYIKLKLRKAISEEISTTKKKPSTLDGENGKDALRESQELNRITGVKVLTHLKDCSLRTEWLSVPCTYRAV
jgi:hypothetical protein